MPPNSSRVFAISSTSPRYGLTASMVLPNTTERALSVFVQPPSVEALRERLTGRATDAPEVIEQRIARAEYELTFASKFDTVVINDDLATAQQDVLRKVKDFLLQ